MKHIYCQLAGIIFLIFLSGGSIEGRDTTRVHSLRVFVSPSALFNFFPGVQMGLEYKINRWSLISEFGYIIPLDNRPENEVNVREDLISGFRIKGVARRHFNKYLFMELCYYHRQINDRIKADFFRFNGSYIEEMDYNIKSILNGLAITVGSEFQFADRWFMDISGGLGVGLQDRSYTSLPADVENTRRPTIFWGYREFRFFDVKAERIPLIAVNFRIKYNLF